MYTGRTVITTNEKVITRENLASILLESFNTHCGNGNQIDYLYNVYKGKQDIQSKIKAVRPEINNIITENRAYEITEFKKGFIWGEPIQYTRRGSTKSLFKALGDIISGDETKLSQAVTDLNDYMVLANKDELDIDLAEWLLIGGQAYRMVLPNEKWEKDSDEAPFKIITLDPRYTFMVRANDLEKTPLMAVTYVNDVANVSGPDTTYYVYTKDKYYIVEDTTIVHEQDLYLGYIPIIEYVTGNARLGAFEIVLPLMNALNSLQSNRLDDVEQHVNSFLAILNADIDRETYDKINEFKMLMLPKDADAKFLSSTLTQTDVQTFSDYLYKTILTICGMPNRNDSGGGDNGIAVIYRDGWEVAESQAKTLEKSFKRSEREFLKIVLKIMRDMLGINLSLSNIDIKFARRYADNILTKVQALSQMLDIGVKPEIAFATCNIWNDPEDVAQQSKPYLEKWELSDVRTNGQEVRDTDKEDNEII